MATIDKYKTSSGATLYRVRFRTPENKQTDKRGFTSKREAERFAATVEVAKMRGEYVAPTLGRVTVGELGPAWLQRQQGHLKPSGFRSYEGVWRLHVEPRWGCIRVSDIRFTDVQAWVSELAARRSAVVVQMSHSVLARILDDAVKDRVLAANPARGVKLPPVVRKQNVYLTAAQLHALVTESGRHHSLVLLLGTAGLRWSEVAARRVCDVDFLRRRVNLHRNAVTLTGEVAVGTLKSGKARAVPLAAFVVHELAATCRGKNRDDLIWGGHRRLSPTARGNPDVALGCGGALSES